MPRSPRKKKSGGKPFQPAQQQQQQQEEEQPSQAEVQEDEEENSTDSVEQAALDKASKDDNQYDQDSLMFEEVDDIELPADDDSYEVTGRGADDRLLGDFPVSSPDMLMDETDSTVTTPYGSPMSAMSGYSSIQKWTGEVKKMLLDDQRQSENRSKGRMFSFPEVLPSLASAGRSESFVEDLEGSFVSPDSEFDMMPTAEELAEKYSNELIEKERSILQKDAKIIELERACREVKNNLDDCQKELKLKTESATSGVEKLKQTLEEKDKCIMETSEKLRKVTESYNSSEKRWKEQQEYLEKQIQKLKSELDANSDLGGELERLTDESRREKRTLEELLEKAKEETVHLKKHFSEEMTSLETELKSLKEEKLQLEEQLQEEIRMLKDKLMLSEQACETALSEKEIIQLELESQELKNRALVLDMNELKEKREEIISQQETAKRAMEELIDSLKQEKERIMEILSNEKYELELQVQNLTEQLNQQNNDNTSEELIRSLKQEKERIQEILSNEKYELELQVQTLTEQFELQKTDRTSDELINSLKQEKERLQEILSNEKCELELQVQNLTEQLEQQEMNKTSEKQIKSMNQEKEIIQEELSHEKHELEVQVQTLKDQLKVMQVQAEVAESTAPVNFFTQESNVSQQDEWLETKKSMENRIAELELEKGNLLLQLVDVDDEQQVAEQAVAAKVEEIRTQAQRQMELEVEAAKTALRESEHRIEVLQRELEESKQRDGERIESAMNTIAWEEKVEVLQKTNKSYLEELTAQRKSADELSSRYEELERKFAELETGRPPIEGILEIDKCDGWSDDTPQIPDPDEGFTEDPQISELKEALQEKQREVDDMYLKLQSMENELINTKEMVTHYEVRLNEINAENSASADKYNDCMKELQRIKEELRNKITQNEAVVVSESSEPISAVGDGWGDDQPALLDEGFNDDMQQLAELKQALTKKDEELATTTDKCRSMEDKLKKALKALKQKNDKLAELKSRLGEDPMNTSTLSVVETSVVPVQEPIISKSVAYDCGTQDFEKMKQECHLKDLRIQELETAIQILRTDKKKVPDDTAKSSLLSESPQQILNQEVITLLALRDTEIETLRRELSQLVSTLNLKNEEIDQLMRACIDMQMSVDEKVELLNDCVAKKDEEVRQAISQYEDFLKDATLNVSQLTKELEEKIREINMLHGQVQEAQELMLETQNEFKSYKRDSQDNQTDIHAKNQELEYRRQVEEQLREEHSRLQSQMNELMLNNGLINEALERAEADKNQLREESVCIQNEYGNKNRELQVQISQLIDQLNERESAISVMETRLKDFDEQSDRIVQEVRLQLEDKTKAVEQFEQALFVKTEECLRLEERVKDGEEKCRIELESRLKEIEDQHRSVLENFAAQNSEDLEQTCYQLAKKNSEVVEIQEQLRQLQQQTLQLENEYSAKCSEVTQKDQALSEMDTLRSNLQSLEATIANYTYALNNANTELNLKNEEVTNLQNICSQYEEKLYNSTMSQDEVQRSLQESQGNLTQCQHDLSNYFNELQNSKMELESLTRSCTEYQETIERLRLELREAESGASGYSTEIQNLKHQLARQQEIESSLNKYLEDLNGATEELGKKNLEMRELEKTCTTRETQLQSLQNSLESLRAEMVTKEILLSEKEYISKLEAEAWEMSALKERDSMDSKQELLAELEEKNREISDLRFELDEGILQEKSIKRNLEEKDREISSLRAEINNRDADINALKQQVDQLAARPTVSTQDEAIAQRLKFAEEEKQMLEMKIDLLQNKLAEVEESEVKCYEDFSKLKILRTELEMDNLRMSAELEQLRRSWHDGDNDGKYKSMENQIVLMSKTLEDRDKLCRDLMRNISELQQAHDALQVRVNDLQLQALPSRYFEGSLEATILELDRQIFSLKIDVDRERKLRELFEGLLFLAATAKKQFESGANRSGGWFGLSDLFSSASSSSPPPRAPATPPRATLSAPMAQQFTPQYGAGPPSFLHTSTPSRPLTPVRPVSPVPVSPAAAFTPGLFDTPGQGPPSPMPQFSLLQENQPDMAIPTSSSSGAVGPLTSA